MRKINQKYRTYPNSSIHRNALAQQFGNVSNIDLFNASYSSRNFVQRFAKWETLLGHTGCVNTVAWNTNGTLLLSGSDDYMLNIYDASSWKMIHSVQSGHHANIFSAKFLPCTSDMKIVSCSGDGMLQYNELDSSSFGGNYFNCHSGTTYEVVVTPGDPNTFFSCGEDGTVRFFDLRTKTKCHCTECADDILIDTKHGVTSISINPIMPFHLAVGCKDSFLYLFDYRTLSTSESGRSVNNQNKCNMMGLFCKFKPEKLRRDASCRITSVQYSNDGTNVLTSYCADYVYAFSLDRNNAKCMGCTELVNSETERAQEDGVGSVPDDSELPPVKRLRLRGDWSDTGPQACPESAGEAFSANNLMQRMSVLFSAFLEDVASSQSTAQGFEENVSHQSDEREVEVSGDSISEVIVESEVNDDLETNLVSGSGFNEDSGRTEHILRENMTDIDVRPEFTKLGEVEAEGNMACMKAEDHCCNSSDKRHEEIGSQTDGCSDEISEDCKETLIERHTNHDRNKAGSSGSYEAGKGRNVVEQLESEDQMVLEAVNDIKSMRNTASRNLEAGRGNVEIPDSHGNSRSNQNLLPLSISNQCSSNLVSTEIGQETSIPSEFMKSNQGVSNLVNESNDVTDEASRHEAAVKIQKLFRQNKMKMSSTQGRDTEISPVFTPSSYSVFKGHRNARTMIKEANFWGDDYVLSGSDCGRIFIWDRHTGELVMLLEGDSRVVNCVQPHPFDPILASSGIDHDIKIWAPLAQGPPDLSGAEEIMERNEQMLEKSCDTITVPASFVFRMLATFRSRRRQPTDGMSDDENLGDNEDED